MSTEAIIGLLESGQSPPPSSGRVNQKASEKPKAVQSQTSKTTPAKPIPKRRASKEAVETSKRNPLVTKTVEMFNGVIMEVSKNQTENSSDT